MDWLRSAYRAKMRTTTYLPPVDVVWYEVPPTTPMYTKQTALRSRFWAKVPENDGVGEQSAGRVCCGRFDVEWYNGKKPDGASGGLVPCGTDEAAKSGATEDDPIFVTTAQGNAPCCDSTWNDIALMGLTFDWTTEGYGNAIVSFDNTMLTDLSTDPPTQYFPPSLFDNSRWPFDQEGAYEAQAIFQFSPVPDVRLLFRDISVTRLETVWWGIGTVKLRYLFNASGHIRTFLITWVSPPPP